MEGGCLAHDRGIEVACLFLNNGFSKKMPAKNARQKSGNGRVSVVLLVELSYLPRC